MLTLDRQRLPARGNDANRTTPAQHELGKLGGRVEQVLAVVEHEEQLLALEEVDDALPARHARPGGDVERGGDHLHEALRVVGRRQLAQPGTVGKLGNNLGRDLHREPCLAHPADTGERHQVVLADQAADHRDRVDPADEARDLHREVSGPRVDRPQLREARRQALVDQLEHPHRLREIPQAVLTEVPQRHVGHDLVGGGRHQHLATVADRHEPGGPVHRRPEIVTVAFHCLSGVHGHANRREALAQQRQLALGRGRHCVGRPLERNRKSVTTGREGVTAPPRDHVPEDRVVARERFAHRIRIVLPTARRSFDVGEEERDRSGRRLRH